jgi:CheY-like chemotaxis protein
MDPSQVDQIMVNICVNARDAISGVGKVTIATENISVDTACCAGQAGGDCPPGEYVLVSVNDSGCGMNTETLSNIFDPFFTTKGVGKGTGLGMATVFGIVKQNQGCINVFSEPGKGSTFRIYLPRLTGETIPGRNDENPEVTLASRGETVLLVEDDPKVIDMCGRMLENLGYKVLRAGTPGEAIRLTAEYAGAIHLLLTDVIMPEMNGRELAKTLQSTYPDLKCLFMSGYTADIIANQGVLHDGIQFIQKPFSVRDVALNVRKALDQN